MSLQVGDVVCWMSQSGGNYRNKTGTVVAVVPAGHRPEPTSKNRNPGAARDHDSYLVRVKGKGLYWPRVSALCVSPKAASERTEVGGGRELTQAGWHMVWRRCSCGLRMECRAREDCWICPACNGQLVTERRPTGVGAARTERGER